MKNVIDSAYDQETNTEIQTRIVEVGNVVNITAEERGSLIGNVMEPRSVIASDNSRIKTTLEHSLNSQEFEDIWCVTDVLEKVPYVTLTYRTLCWLILLYTDFSFLFYTD